MDGMDKNSGHRRESQQSQQSRVSSNPDRILDRKIERHGLTQSFSSNLARKGPSPAQKVPDRSVRDMVSLFEKPGNTSKNQPSPRPRFPSSGANEDQRGGRNGDSGKTTAQQQPHRQEQTQRVRPRLITSPSMFAPAQVCYQVEDYSLTLLKHRSYFNNRPLGRCLDESIEKDRATRIQRVKSRTENAHEVDTGGKQNANDGQGQEGKGVIVPLSKSQNPSPIQRLNTLMSELVAWQEIPEPGTPLVDKLREIRSSEETETFWRSVRTQLWVNDDEIYGETRRPEAPEKKVVDVPEAGNENIALNRPDPPPPPMPTRPPPPVPTTPRIRSFSATSSQRTPHSTAPSLDNYPSPVSEYLTWDDPSATSSVRMSISAPGHLDITEFLYETRLEAGLPIHPEPKRPLPIPPTKPSHSRYPSSSNGSHWVRPPTWRSPSSLASSSPPPVPPLPVPIPAPLTTNNHRRSNHSRNRHHHHHPHPSNPSTSNTSTHSIAVTDGGGSSSRSMHSTRRWTQQTSTSSTATRSTRANSGTDPSTTSHHHHHHRPGGGAPRRRLTTEEKLSEIDTFLSPEREGGDCWI